MDERGRDLVEPEGVNAGSADSTAEGGTPHGEVRPGGHPERAEAQVDRTENDEIVDAPFQPRDPNAPSLEQSVEEGAR
ncbi:hypothetical protein [Sporichthya sp.]|uniref:hypothetical protein n=1 Tax=Sporichthya sp. TaxID=65475 RepID=UPI00184F78DD|nr:hypothetical protein [Sporichthya sp.]MBA3744933.1 hypothetical protein [Sporichthya sp.]